MLLGLPMGMVWFYYIIRVIIILVIKIFFRAKIIHKDRLPKKKGYVIAMNHSNIADVLYIMGLQSRIVHYLAKKELFQTRIGKWFHLGMQEIPVDRQKGDNKEAVAEAVKKLKHGGVVGIFPEGTTKRLGDMKFLKPHKGVARLALLAKVPVVPAGISGNTDVWRKKSKKRGIEQQILVIGKPMYFKKYYGQEDDKEVLQRIAEDIMAEVEKLVEEGDEIRLKKHGASKTHRSSKHKSLEKKDKKKK